MDHVCCLSNHFHWQKVVQSEVSGITPSPENAQALCKDSLSHAEGLKFAARTRSRLKAGLGRSCRLGSCHHAHLEVEAGEADCVILLLFAFSLLKGEQSKKM